MSTRSSNHNLSLLVILGSSAVAAVVMTAATYSRSSGEKKKPCVPNAPASIWETIQQLSGSNPHRFSLKLARKINNFCYRLPIGVYIIADSTVARDILTDPMTDKPPAFYEVFEYVIGQPTIISSPNTPYMRSMRKGTRPAFSKVELNRINEVAAKQSAQMVGRLKSMEVFEPGLEAMWLTFMVICESAFEYTATNEDFRSFFHNTDVVFRELSLKLAVYPWRKYIGSLIPSMRLAYRCRRDLRVFTSKMLGQYRGNPSKSTHLTLIKLLNDHIALKSDENLAVSEALLWALAGFETTGATLANCLVLLARNPDVQRKLRKLVLEADDPKKIDYLHYVIKETHRLVPVSAMGSVRRTGRDHDAGDYIIPKGAICFTAHYACGHNAAVFNEPELFRPERWEGATQNMLESVTPFSVGPRNCPGQPLAQSELVLALSLLVKELSFSVVEEGSLQLIGTLKFVGYRLGAQPVTN